MLKRLFLVILCFFYLLGTSYAKTPKIQTNSKYPKHQAGSSNCWIIAPRVGVGWIKLGMDIGYVKKSLGEQRKVIASDKYYLYDYEEQYGLLIGVDERTKKIVAIIVTKPINKSTEYKMSNGLRVGKSFVFASKKLGDNPGYHDEEGMVGTKKYTFYYTCSNHIILYFDYFDEFKIVAIGIFK